MLQSCGFQIQIPVFTVAYPLCLSKVANKKGKFGVSLQKLIYLYHDLDLSGLYILAK